MLVGIISICIVLVVLFVVSHKNRIVNYNVWGTSRTWTKLSIITTIIAILLSVILLVITFKYYFISLPLIATYIILLFFTDITGLEILYAVILNVMTMFMLLMLQA